MFHHLLTLLLVQFTEVFSVISRNPSCGKYTANFTIIHTDKYFQGQVIDVFSNSSLKDCILRCIFRPGCVLFNLKLDNSKCELIGSHVGTLKEKQGWEVQSTEYTIDPFFRRGPMCNYVKAKCEWNFEYCADTCEGPGFHCVKQIDLAFNKKVKFSSERDSYPGVDLVDNNVKTFWHTLSKEIRPWFSVDLEEKYLIPLIVLFNRIDGGNKLLNPERQVALTVRIGANDAEDMTKNAVCEENISLENDLTKRIICAKPLIGRFVSVKRENGQFLALHFGGIRVYAF